ncbi:hypothetical protein [Flavobacterium sp. 3HN19-14]|uniref:hypothetical protein n=1 Tax=Flavobacterium sp. 3HN19-14 TaxID=3448133 RepID=UPI003EE0D834
MEIQLNLISLANEDNLEVVIMQKNYADNYSELAVAWKVIKVLGPGDNHPFVFPLIFQVSASDAWATIRRRPRLMAERHLKLYGQYQAMRCSITGLPSIQKKSKFTTT